MKCRIRKSAGVALFALTVALVLGTGVGAAHALLNDVPVPVGTSGSNPSAGPDAWWRMGWGNSVYPDFTLTPPSVTDPEFIVGTLYVVDRDPATLIDTTQPDQYYRTARGTGTNLSQILDLPGTLAYPPFGGSIEGMWYFHFKYFSNLAYASTQFDIPVGVDVTPPAAVVGLNASPALGITGDPDVWVASTRAHLTWTPGMYDALSGDAYYQVLIDDQPIVPEDGGSTQGRVYSIPGLPTPGSITIENMPAGRHKVSVAVVDRATNQGEVASTYFNSDPDVPTISVSVGSASTRFSQVVAVVRDAGGVAFVDFAVDGVPVGHITSAPYTVNVDMEPFGPGIHTFSATVTDMFGRTATAFADAVSDPNAGFKTGIFTTIDDFRYPDSSGASPVRFLSARTIRVSFAASTTVDAFAYTLSRSAATLPSMPSAAGEPPTALMAASSTGATLDIASWQTVQTAPPSSMTGVVDPIEGAWFLTARAVKSAEYPPLSSTFRRVQFVIDVTPPSAPTGLAPVDGFSASAWTSSARRDVQWNNPVSAGLAQYDALSGDAYYMVTVNGNDSGDGSGIVYPVLSQPYSYLSVEDLVAGENVIEVSVVDNAGNMSVETAMTLLVDPDIPTIKFTRTSDDGLATESPLNRTTCGRYITLQCLAADGGGVAYVDWYIHGVWIGRATSAPYSMPADMARFGRGWHEVSARVTDMVGRSASASVGITVTDVTSPRISYVSDTPDPFYPVIRNRYKDDAIVRFTISENAMIWMHIYNSKGVKVRTVTSTWRRRGRQTLKWNGRMDDGTMAPDGTYRLWIGADDAAGNTTYNKTKTTRLRSFIVKRLSRNRVKLIFR